jgi:hypothetical protein
MPESTKTPLVLSATACLISITALSLAVFGLRRDPLGTSMRNYRFDSPQQTIESFRSIIGRADLRAFIELLMTILDSETTRSLGRDPTAMILFAGHDNLISDALAGGRATDFSFSVRKTIEVANSANARNVGLLVSFVEAQVKGVAYRDVFYFRRDREGRTMMGVDMFQIPYGTTASDEDKAVQTAIEEFKKNGKV